MGPFGKTEETAPVAEPASGDPAGVPAACIRVSAIALTDVGRKRHNNEDSILLFDLHRQAGHKDGEGIAVDLAPPGMLLAVADGMGGHQAGQVASALSVGALPKDFLAALSQQDASHDVAGPALRQAVEAVNRSIYEAASRDPEQEGMGTTLTAALLDGKRLLIAQVGDSRAYLMNASGLKQLTVDQTVGSLLAAQFPPDTDSHVLDLLVQAVGAQPKVDVALTEGALENGDRLLLCSDGLYKVVPDIEIGRTLANAASLKKQAEALIRQANENGGPDNISVILAQIESSGN